MSDPETPDASDLYSERLIRSVAHNIGNAVNVLSGRLSLLEMEDGMRPESLEMLALMKDRLRRTQGELRGAVRFVSETLRETNGVAPNRSEHVLTAINESESKLGPISGKATALASEVAQRCHAKGDLRFALEVLGKGVCAIAIQGEHPVWSLEAKPEGLALEVPVASTSLPSDRRYLMEPWFEASAINLPQNERRGRLEVAVALGRLEDGGANVSVLQSNGEERSVSRLQVLWTYP